MGRPLGSSSTATVGRGGADHAPFTLRLPIADLEALQRLAAARGMAVGALVRNLIGDHLRADGGL